MLPEPVPGLEKPSAGGLLDRFGRQHDYVRLSVTDRCNYRCTYCMPATGMKFFPRKELLSFAEMERIVRVLARCGVRRVRLTGGEPTVRPGIEMLVGSLANIDGVEDLSMTTNGHRLAPIAAILAKAGLQRVNISIDSLDPERFGRLTRGGDLSAVIRGIDAAVLAGLTPLKLNMVVVGGENEEEVESLVAFASERKATLRLIEFMPFDGNGSLRRHVPSRVLRDRLARRWHLEPMESTGGGPAKQWMISELGVAIGFISPITEHFCQACNRLRVQADGHLRTCLSREAQPSLRDVLRAGASDEQLERDIRDRLWAKVPGHEAHLEAPRAFEGVMTAIGG